MIGKESEKERLIRNIEVMDDDMAEILKKKTPQERLEMAFGMWRSARKLLTSHLRSQHPGWDDKKIQSEVARRMSHGAA